MPDFLENLCVGSISRVEYLLIIRGFNDESSPQSFIEIEGRPARPMADRHERNFILVAIDVDLFLVHPVHLYHVASFGEDVLRAEAGHEAGVV